MPADRSNPSYEGNLEQPPPGLIVREPEIAVRGWIALDRGQERLVGFANKKQIDFDFTTDSGQSHRLSFAATIPCADTDPLIHLQLWVIGADGRTRRWKRRKIWVDPAVLPPPTFPVLRGQARLDLPRNRISGTVDASPDVVQSIAAMQAGDCIGFIDSDDRQNGLTEFSLPLLPIPGSKNLVHLRISLGGGRPDVAWLAFDRTTGAIVSEDMILQPRGEESAPPIAAIGGLPGLQAINGLSPGAFRADGNSDLDLSEETTRVLVEQKTDTGDQIVARYWRNDVNGNGKARIPGFVFPPALLRSNPPTEAKQKPSVVLFRREPAPTDELYAVAPLRQLAKRREFALQIVDTDADSLTPERCDSLLSPGTSVIVSRYVAPVLLDSLARNRPGLRDVFYVIDDDLTRAVDDRGLPPRYRQLTSTFAQTAFQAMAHLSTRLVVSSEVLAHRFASTKTDLVSPPYIHPAHDLAHLDNIDRIRIAYTGTVTHRTDFRFVAGVLGRLLKNHPRLELLSFLGKFTPSALAELPNVVAKAPSSWDDFKQADWRAHIGIAPMLRTPYNSGKSIVKIMDIARFGALGLYSNVEPFSGAVTSGQNGFLLENDPAAWEACIERLIAAPDQIKPIAQQAQNLAIRLGDIEPLVKYWEQRLF